MTIKEKKLMRRLREINRVDNFNEHVEIVRELLYEREGILVFEGIDFHGGKLSDYYDDADADDESFSGLVFIDCDLSYFNFTECKIFDITFVNCKIFNTVFDLGTNYEDLFNLKVSGNTSFTYEDIVRMKELNKGDNISVSISMNRRIENE